ncbi:MAG: site-specific integrase [Erysipelotrichaceae bacterium]|nr:site-specific integrase [Erysipelotrichaceae bacterium]
MNKFKKQLYISQRFLDRSETWTFQVQIRKDDFVCCKNFREKEYGSARTAYEAAIRYRDKTLLDYANGNYLNITDKTVEDCFNESFVLMPLSLATKNKHSGYFNNFEEYKYINIQKLSSEDIQMSLNKLNERFSNDIINRHFYIWKRIIKTAIVKKYINKDLCLEVVLPKSKKIENFRNKKQITKEDFLIVLDFIKDSKLSNYKKEIYRDLLLTIYYTGMRPGEALALNKNDIDFKNKTISINKELNSSGVLRNTKTQKSIRTIPMNDQLSNILKNTLKISNSNLLFGDEKGNYFKEKKISQRIGKICKGKVNFTIYSLRHLFSTDLLMNGTDPKTHQELMGHSSYNMSLYYADTNEERKKKAVEDR